MPDETAEWQLLKQEIDSLGYDVDILFVAWVHNYDELEILQRANRCQLPFLYDPQGDMQKINPSYTKWIFILRKHIEMIYRKTFFIFIFS